MGYANRWTLDLSLEGTPWTGREFVFSEHARDGILQETDFISMVRSED